MFNDPIVTNVTLTLGTDTLFNFNGTTATGVGTDPTKLVVTDDFAYAEPVSILDAVPILPGPNGTANVLAKATATIGTPFTGTVATFSYDTAAQASQFTATINWGDGHVSNGKVQANGQGGFDVVGTNTFGEAIATPVAVHVQDFGIPRERPRRGQRDPGRPGGHRDGADRPAQPLDRQSGCHPYRDGYGLGGSDGQQWLRRVRGRGRALGTAPVDSTGKATFTTTKLPIGSHNLSAVFLGSRDFNTSTSTAVNAVVRADVTSQLAITLGRIQRKGRRFAQHVTIVNYSGTLHGPLVLVLSNLTSGTKLYNASGTTTTVPSPGNPFIIIPLGTSGQLVGGASIGVDLIFTARPLRRIHYNSIVLAGLSQP